MKDDSAAGAREHLHLINFTLHEAASNSTIIKVRTPSTEITPSEYQQDSSNLWSDCQIRLYDGFIFMKCLNMEKLSWLATSHAGICGHELKLVLQDTSQGSGATEKWKCPLCLQELKLNNCNLVRTKVSENKSKFTCLQPEINVKDAKLFSAGVGMRKTIETIQIQTKLSIKIADYRNLQNTNNKVCLAIHSVFKEIRFENRVEHVDGTCKESNYDAGIVWEKDGELHSTCGAVISADGAGCTRAFHHRIKGRQLRAAAPSSDYERGYVIMWTVGVWCGWASGRLVNRYIRSCKSE
jgi:hypothetical protein